MRRCSLLFLLTFLACCGVEDPSGLDEPVRVLGGQLVPGSIPSPDPDLQDLPSVTSFEVESSIVQARQGSKSFRGRVSDSAVAVAFRFRDLGSGHWIVPTGALDPQYPGERTWSVSADFPTPLPAGKHVVVVAGILPSGGAGPTIEREVCAASLIPDNFHGCDPSLPLPAAVVSLSWSVDADLDLEVVTSDGRVVNPESPLLDPVEQGSRPDADASRIDRDSVASCEPDGFRRESLVLQERPAPGTRLRIFAKLKNACGHRSAAFRLQVFEARGSDESRELLETFSESGTLHEGEAGNPVGLLVAEYRF